MVNSAQQPCRTHPHLYYRTASDPKSARTFRTHLEVISPTLIHQAYQQSNPTSSYVDRKLIGLHAQHERVFAYWKDGSWIQMILVVWGMMRVVYLSKNDVKGVMAVEECKETNIGYKMK